jgi:hypothetical protein
MQWPSCGRPPEDEATRAISVLWIIFNHFGTAKEFSHFLDADTTNDALVSGMFRELELVSLKFPPYLVDHRLAQLMLSEAYEFIASALRWLTLRLSRRGPTVAFRLQQEPQAGRGQAGGDC